MKMKLNRSVPAGVLIGLLSIGAVAETKPSAPMTTADAQSAEAAGELQEIVVTARKRVEKLQTVPIAVTAFSGEQLKEQSIKTLTDIQVQVPGLFIQEGFDDVQSLTVTLRGRKQNDTASTLDSSVGVYVDGLYSARGVGLGGSLLDVSQLQVLRGPQGTLYGRSTTGGAIVIATNNPTDELSGSIDVTGTNFRGWNVTAIANAPISDHLEARFVAQLGRHEGFGHNAIGGGLDSEDSQYYRAKLRATWADHWEGVLSAHWESNQSGGSIVKIVGLTPDNFNGNGLPPGGFINLETQAELGLSQPQATAYLQNYVAQQSSNSHFWDNASNIGQSSYVKRYDVGLNINGDLGGDVAFRSISGYQSLYRDTYFPAPIAESLFYIASHTTSEYLSQEFEVLGTLPTVNWVAGIYGGRELGNDDTSSVILPNVFGPSVSLSNFGILNSNYSAFAQAVWQFIPDWHFTAGLRDSHDEREMNATELSGTVCQIPTPGELGIDLPPFQSQCPRRFKNSFAKPSWLLSLDHQLTSDVLAYVKVATGYRSGGENEGGAVDNASFVAFRPETNTEYEAGVKSEFFDHTVRLNVDGYLSQYKDLQISTAIILPDGGFAGIVTNAATATVSGMELEGDVLIASGLELHYSSAFTDAHYTHFVDVTGDRSHEPFSVPRWTGSLGPQYILPTSVGPLRGELDYGYRSAVVLDGHAALRSQVTQGGMGLLNGRLNLHVDAWNADIALFGRNITNRKYYDQTASFESLGANLAYAAPPGVYGIEFTEHFGRSK